jgi:LysR family transcriptional regulator, low CO2-responsive transcriptional regulator
VEGTPLDRPWHAVTTRNSTPPARLFIDHLLHAPGAAAFEPVPAPPRLD